MQRILMVCLGNICRSPMAEGVMRELIRQRNLPYTVDSAGTNSFHTGEPPDSRAVRVALQHGIDISGLRARTFKPADFDRFDRIFVMDSSNYATVTNMAASRDHRHVCLLLDVLNNQDEREVPDPYYGGEEGFEAVFQLIDKACGKILDQLTANHRAG